MFPVILLMFALEQNYKPQATEASLLVDNRRFGIYYRISNRHATICPGLPVTLSKNRVVKYHLIVIEIPLTTRFWKGPRRDTYGLVNLIGITLITQICKNIKDYYL